LAFNADNGNNPSYQGYLDLIRPRLQQDKFELSESQQVEGYKVDLFGYKLFFSTWRINYWAVCQVAYFDTVDVDTVRSFSNAMYEFDKNYKKPIGTYTLRSFSVLAAQQISEDAKSYVDGFDGRRFEFARYFTEHPVLAELGTSNIFHYQKPGVVARFAQKGTIDAANKYFLHSMTEDATASDPIEVK